MPRFLELLLVGLAGITLAAASADKACPTDQGAEPGVGSYVVHEDATIKVSECLPDVHAPSILRDPVYLRGENCGRQWTLQIWTSPLMTEIY